MTRTAAMPAFFSVLPVIVAVEPSLTWIVLWFPPVAALPVTVQVESATETSPAPPVTVLPAMRASS